MASPTRYPFSDLTPRDIHDIVAIAHAERAEAIRQFFSSFFRRSDKKSSALAELATQMPARVRPC